MEHLHVQHAEHGLGLTLSGVAAIVLMLCLAVAYLRGVRHLRRAGRRWPRARTAAFLTGVGLLAIGASPPLMQAAMADFRLHMLQHLLAGMLAPLGLVLGAPVCLMLRRLPKKLVLRLSGLLHSAWIGFVAHPCIALLLNVGGLYLLYLTPLYDAMHASLVLHGLVHVHIVLAGCLFTWSVLDGPDPVPRRHSMRLRLATVFIAIAAHTLLSKVIYAYGLPGGVHPQEQIEAGAQWMYYGGDVAELLLLIAMFARRKHTPGAGDFFRDAPAAAST
ncbi:MAG TPA: cytochrome c oxidase assembly protein [Pseudomonadales bacterium]